MRLTLAERLWSKASNVGGEGCWVWQASKNKKKGYGKFMLDGRSRMAHSVSYELHHGHAVPVGLEIDHKCRNRACVNPHHLEAVTHFENLRRGHSSVGIALRTGRCFRGHDRWYTNPNSGLRRCMTCTADRNRRYRAAKNYQP